MSRWKPPAPKSSAYITPDGYRALQDNLQSLWRRRAEVTVALSAAAAVGAESAAGRLRGTIVEGLDAARAAGVARVPGINVGIALALRVCDLDLGLAAAVFGVFGAPASQ